MFRTPSILFFGLLTAAALTGCGDSKGDTGDSGISSGTTDGGTTDGGTTDGGSTDGGTTDGGSTDGGTTDGGTTDGGTTDGGTTGGTFNDLDGESLFLSSCSGCHGSNAEGVSGVAPSLADAVGEKSDDAIVEIILNGRGDMPAIGVSEDEAYAIVDYLRELFGS